MCLPIGFEIHYFIYFPTPLYTKTRCQAGFCVCWGFFFLKKAVADNVEGIVIKKGKKIYHKVTL